jgi:hypothetical protein
MEPRALAVPPTSAEVRAESADLAERLRSRRGLPFLCLHSLLVHLAQPGAVDPVIGEREG